MKILAVDPGGTTGWVVVETSAAGVTFVDAGHSEFQEFCDWMGESLWPATFDVVVAEAYMLTMRTLKNTRQYDALHILGVLRWLSESRGVPLFLQQASTAKRSVDDEILKNLGLWEELHGPHERDAMRHAITYARNHVP